MFSSIIDSVPSSQVLDKLEPSLTELEFVQRGIKANKFIKVISTDKGIRSYIKKEQKNLILLLIEMAPIYLTFGFNVCDYLSRRVRTNEKKR